MNNLKKLIKITVLNFSLLLIILLLAEIILRLDPVSDPFEQDKITIRHYFNPVKLPNRSFTFKIEDSLPGFENYIQSPTITSNNLGFRNSKNITSKDKEDNEYRIFAIGGSTTECALLADGDDWPSLLGEQLNSLGLEKPFRVVNTGQSGHTLADHLHLIIQKIIHLKPDLLVLYVGVNDLYRPISKNDIYRLELANAHKNRGINLFLTDFQLGRRLYFALKGITPADYHMTAHTRQKSLAQRLQRAQVSTFPKGLNFEFSKSNLEAIIGICQAMKIELLVTTQAVSWDEQDTDLDNWHTAFYANKRYAESDLRMAMDSLNSELRNVSLRHNTSVIEIQRMLKPTSENFYDDMHFNISGSKNMSNIVFKHLLENPHLIGENLSNTSLR